MTTTQVANANPNASAGMPCQDRLSDHMVLTLLVAVRKNDSVAGRPPFSCAKI
jgi:hypothetical protein